MHDLKEKLNLRLSNFNGNFSNKINRNKIQHLVTSCLEEILELIKRLKIVDYNIRNFSFPANNITITINTIYFEAKILKNYKYYNLSDTIKYGKYIKFYMNKTDKILLVDYTNKFGIYKNINIDSMKLVTSKSSLWNLLQEYMKLECDAFK